MSSSLEVSFDDKGPRDNVINTLIDTQDNLTSLHFIGWSWFSSEIEAKTVIVRVPKVKLLLLPSWQGPVTTPLDRTNSRPRPSLPDLVLSDSSSLFRFRAFRRLTQYPQQAFD